MEELGEEVPGAATPGLLAVVEPTLGQKVAGAVLRVFGLLLFGLALLFGVLPAIGMVLSFYAAGVVPVMWRLVAVVLGVAAVVAIGSLMASFGVVLSGSVSTVEGSRIHLWILASVGKDFAFAIGVLLPVVAMITSPAVESWIVVGTAVLLGLLLQWLGVSAHRLMKRLEATPVEVRPCLGAYSPSTNVSIVGSPASTLR